MRVRFEIEILKFKRVKVICMPFLILSQLKNKIYLKIVQIFKIIIQNYNIFKIIKTNIYLFKSIYNSLKN